RRFCARGTLRRRPRRLRHHGSRAQGPGDGSCERRADAHRRPRSRRDRGGCPVIVSAPATSANLGPGFDCAAVALDLWNELEVTEGDGVLVEGEGADELPTDLTNLAVRAYALVAPPAGKRFRFLNRIPLERGLGSSAAAIALGLAAAANGTRTHEELLALGLQLESHADNLGAALPAGAAGPRGGP